LYPLTSICNIVILYVSKISV